MIRLFAIALLAGVAGTASATDALDTVNAQRAQRGLPAYERDDALTVAAEQAATFRAHHGLFGHTGNDFVFLPAGVSADAAGCAAYPPSMGFMACATYESYRYAGASTVIGRDGRAYHHLFVRQTRREMRQQTVSYSYFYSQTQTIPQVMPGPATTYYYRGSVRYSAPACVNGRCPAP